MNQIYKYPRTQHIRGSRIQNGDEDLSDVPMSELAGLHLVVEEKMDGANCAISFGEGGKLYLQSRGHYLTGGPRERQFDLFKTWANTYAPRLHAVLGERYILYGEWLYAKHTVFYNALPHYFMEFDMLDTETGRFLDTPSRWKLLEALPMVVSVRVIEEGTYTQRSQLEKLIQQSAFIRGGHMEELRSLAQSLGQRPEQVVGETDPHTTMEGLYIKAERDGEVVGRYKYVRSSFSQALLDSESHWMERPILPNQLAEGVDLFAW